MKEDRWDAPKKLPKVAKPLTKASGARLEDQDQPPYLVTVIMITKSGGERCRPKRNMFLHNTIATLVIIILSLTTTLY